MVPFKLNFTTETTLFSYMEKQVDKLMCHGQNRTAETYHSTLNSFRNFRNNTDLSLRELSNEVLSDYAFHLKSRGISPNTVAFYLKKATSRLQQSRGRRTGRKPLPLPENFRFLRKDSQAGHPLKGHPGIEASGSLRLSLQKFCPQHVPLLLLHPRHVLCRLAHLRKTDLHDGILTYRRQKTGQLLAIHWEPCMRRIADKHRSEPTSPYLLDIINPSHGDIRKQCHNAITLINRHLKEIGRSIGLPLPLTMYVARHSWASIARNEGIPLSVISEGMGHESERTTRIYLASLETQVINEANKKILQKL